MNDTEFKKLLGSRIQELRLKKGLTQEQLSEMIDVGERNLSKLECGKIFVKSSTVTKLLSALEVEPQELFDFSTLKQKNEIKKILKNAIDNDLVDIDLLYKIYRSVKI